MGGPTCRLPTRAPASLGHFDGRIDRAFVSMTSIVGRSSFYQADAWCPQAQRGTWYDEWCDEYATRPHPERFTDRALLFKKYPEDYGN